MPLTPHEVDMINQQLWPSEKVELSIKQSMIRPRISPSIIAVTDQRVIIIKRTAVNLRSNVDTIPFKDIASVRISNGVVFSSVFLRVLGFATAEEQGATKKGEEGELDGLDKNDAKALADLIEKRIISGPSQLAN